MKLFATLLVSLALLSFVGVAQAAKGEGKKGGKGGGVVQGQVVKVAEDGKSITIKVKDKATSETKEVTVAVDSKTAYTVDGKEAKVADLKPGLRVKVSPATGTATAVDATEAKPKQK